jgi:hypothetical protein
MSLPTFSDAAVSKARQLVSEARYRRPVIFVRWQPAAKNMTRGPKGEVVWTHIADAGLHVTVLDWHPDAWPDKTDAPIETTRIGDLDVCFVGTPLRHLLEGKIIDFDGEEFVVR